MENLIYYLPISVANVYGKVPDSAPDGYAYTGEFRPVLAGDTFRTDYGAALTAGTDWDPNAPRLILRRKLTFAEKWMFLEGEEGYRVPKEGEFFCLSSSASGVCFANRCEVPPAGQYIILEPVEGFTPVKGVDYSNWVR